MKKTVQKLLLALLVAMLCANVKAQTSGNCGTEGHEADVTWEYDSGTLTISGAGEIKTYSTSRPLDYPWYTYANDIQTVIIGEGITNIPAWAFAMYENLLSIHLPSTLKTIGWACLEETALWNVSLPEGLEKIEGYAFMMTPLPAACIPSTVTEIGERAFGYCDDLLSVGCYADTPPTLGSNAFGDSPYIETVYVKSAKVADYKAATGWEDFGDKIKSPSGYCGPDGSDDDSDDDITKATWTFDMNTRTLTISGTKMGQYNRPWESVSMGGSGGGFNEDNNVGYPKGIYHVIIGEGITAIPNSAFYMEVGIKSVNLPSTLTAIGMNAFGECENIETITCNATTPPTLADDGNEDYVFYGMSGEIATITAIYVPAASIAAYTSAAGWSTYADKIKGYNVVLPTTATTSTAHWTTYYNSASNMVADANTTIYQVSLDGTSVTLTEVPDRIINAGHGVVMKSTATSIALQTSASESATSYDDNDLLGSATDVYPVAGKKRYVLAYQNSTLGFYKLGDAVTIPAGKAYLEVSSAAAPWFIDFSEDEGTPTKIEEPQSEVSEEDVIYTLQGQRVSQPLTSGVYIVNGKKVFIRK